MFLTFFPPVFVVSYQQIQQTENTSNNKSFPQPYRCNIQSLRATGLWPRPAALETETRKLGLDTNEIVTFILFSISWSNAPTIHNHHQAHSDNGPSLPWSGQGPGWTVTTPPSGRIFSARESGHRTSGWALPVPASFPGNIAGSGVSVRKRENDESRGITVFLLPDAGKVPDLAQTSKWAFLSRDPRQHSAAPSGAFIKKAKQTRGGCRGRRSALMKNAPWARTAYLSRCFCPSMCDDMICAGPRLEQSLHSNRVADSLWCSTTYSKPAGNEESRLTRFESTRTSQKRKRQETLCDVSLLVTQMQWPVWKFSNYFKCKALPNDDCGKKYRRCRILTCGGPCAQSHVHLWTDKMTENYTRWDGIT